MYACAQRNAQTNPATSPVTFAHYMPSFAQFELAFWLREIIFSRGSPTSVPGASTSHGGSEVAVFIINGKLVILFAVR